MVNRYAVQQKSAYACYPDMEREYVPCPIPRRTALGLFTSSAEVSGQHKSSQSDIYESIGDELLDIILPKGDGLASKQINKHMPMSPPFFSGSPPNRVSNPLIHDAQFVEEKHYPLITCSTHLKKTAFPILNTCSSREGGYASGSFSSSPVIRVEGFKALSKDCHSCSVTALV